MKLKGGTKMKKAKLIGLVAGLMALAVGMGATYAWFTNTATGDEINVTAATISVAIGEVETEANDLENKLPGETASAPFLVENTGSREAVVKLTPTGLTAKDGKGITIDAERLALITTDLKAVLDASYTIYDPDDGSGSVYVWMDAGDEIEGEISITLTGEFGGNYLGSGTVRTPDVPDEHGSVFTFTYEAYAVQGTQDAVKDIWGNETYISALTDVMFPNIP